MKHLICTTFLIAILSIAINAQKVELAKNDSVNIERAQKLVTKILGTKRGYNKCLIFSIGSDLLFIYDSTNVFNFYFLSENFNYTTQQMEFNLAETKRVDINKKPLHKFWFLKRVCSKSFMYTGNQNVPLHGNYIYFLMRDEANKICEFNLPVQGNGGTSYKQKIPLNKKLFNYLLNELLPYISKID